MLDLDMIGGSVSSWRDGLTRSADAGALRSQLV